MKLGSILSGLANTIPVEAIINLAATVKAYTLNSFAAPNGPVGMNGQRITGLGTPTASTDAATKGYADTAASTAQTNATSAANSYTDGKVQGVAKTARGTFTGNGSATTFDAFHNLGNSVVNITVLDSSGNLVLVDTPPKSGAATTTSLITFVSAPAAADGAYSWIAVG